MEINTKEIRKMRLETISWEQARVYIFIDLKQSASKQNVHVIRSRFKVIQEWFKDKEFTRDTFNLFISYLQEKGYKISYINNFIKMGKLLDHMLKLDCIQDYTYFKTPHYKYVDYLTPEEIQAIAEVNINYIRFKKELNYRYKTLYYFLATTGCRIQEALKLSWQDYFHEYVIFRETKNGEERIVPIRKRVRELLDNLPRNSESVFSIHDGAFVNQDLKRRTKVCGIKKRVYCHLFRHSFVSQMLKLRVPEKYIMRITGHKKSDTLGTYAHAMIADLEAVLDSHPLLMGDQTLDEIGKKYKEFSELVVNTNKFQFSVEEQKGVFILKIVDPFMLPVKDSNFASLAQNE